MRAKKEKALELKRKAEEAKEFAEDQAGRDLKGVLRGERSLPLRASSRDSAARTGSDGQAQTPGDAKGGFFQLVSQSKETDDASKDIKPRKLKLGAESRQRLAAAISQPHPNTIKETITNESSVQSRGATQRYAKEMKITVAVSSKTDLQKAAGEGSQRTGTAAPEYGLADDGGIF